MGFRASAHNFNRVPLQGSSCKGPIRECITRVPTVQGPEYKGRFEGAHWIYLGLGCIFGLCLRVFCGFSYIGLR